MPPETQTMMNSGISSAGTPERMALKKRLALNAVRSGCQPLRWLMMYTSTSCVRPIRMPGTAPAMNSAPMDAPEIIA